MSYTTRDEDRAKQERAFGDAVYDVYMRGGNPDQVDRDDVADEYYQTYNQEDAADYAARRAMERS